MTRRPVLQKTYTSPKAFERDAEKLYKQGYIVASTTTERGSVKLGASIVRMVALFGVFTGPSRNPDTISVTYRLSNAGVVPSPSFAS